MVYRDTRDPRIEQCKQLIAEEPRLRLERAAIRGQVDALQEQVDALAMAEHHSGLVSKLAGLFGGGVVPEHADLAEDLAALIDRERVLDGQLAEVSAARTELAEREAAILQTARTMPGPIGDELRALDRDIAQTVREIAALAPVVDAAEHAETLVLIAAKLRADPRASAGVAMSLVEAIANAPVTRDIFELQLEEAVAAAEPKLVELRVAIDRLRVADDRWRADDHLTNVRERIASSDRSDLAHRAAFVATTISSVLTYVGLAQRRLHHHRDLLVTRQRELALQTS